MSRPPRLRAARTRCSWLPGRSFLSWCFGEMRMRLALKFTLAFLGGMCVVLGVYAYSISKREIVMYTLDMKQDHHVLGCAMAPDVRRAWQDGGEAAVQELIRQTNLA